MRTVPLLILLCVFSSAAAARDVYVKPHVRSDGTFVGGHYRSAPNGSRLDNYSSKGNVNPYTGERGTVDSLLLPVPRRPK